MKRKQHILNNEELLIVPSSKYFNLQVTMEAPETYFCEKQEMKN